MNLSDLIILIFVLFVAYIVILLTIRQYNTNIIYGGKSKNKNIMELRFFNPKFHGKICKLTESIINGKKTVEGRAYNPNLHKLKKGDKINIVDKDVNILCDVTYINKYSDVKEYLKEETIEKALPNCVNSIKEGIELYNIFTQPEKRENLRKQYGYGFIGIGIEVKKVTWKSNLKKEHFDNIKFGKKTSEGRLNVGKWKQMKVGHYIEFENNGEKIMNKIKDIKKYNSFKEMLEGETIEKTLPGRTIENGLNDIYYKYYKPEDEKKYGVIAIQL